MSAYNVVEAKSFDGLAKGAGSHAVAFSHYCNLSLQIGVDENGKLVSNCVEEQAKQAFLNIRKVIEKSGHHISDTARISIFLTDMRDLKVVRAKYLEVFRDCLPTLSIAGVKSLPNDAKVGIDGLLTHGLGTIPNAPQANDLIKLTKNTATAPILAASNQVVAFSHYNNVTAQLPINPSIGRIEAECLCSQARQCFKNLAAALAGINVGLDDVVKVTIFTTDITKIDMINKVYREFFPRSAIARAVGYTPARTIVPVSSLPHGAKIAVEATAAHGDGTPPQIIEDRHGIVIIARNKADAPKCELSTQSVAFSHYNHLSAQLPMKCCEKQVYCDDFTAQCKQVFENIKAIVNECKHEMNEVVKINAYITDMSNQAAFEAVFLDIFKSNAPALRLVGVDNLPLGAKVMADAIVSNPEGTPPAK